MLCALSLLALFFFHRIDAVGKRALLFIGCAAAVFILGMSASIWHRRASSQHLSEYKLFKKCFSLITGRAVPLDSPYLRVLAEHKIPAVDLCYNIFSEAHLNPEGIVESSNRENPFAKDVLARFQLLHQSWFNRVGFTVNDSDFATSTVLDMQSSANYLSWILFDGRKLDDLFLVNQNPQALRKAERPEEFILEYEVREEKLHRLTEKPWVIKKDPISGINEFWKPKWVPTGDLMGFTLPARRAIASGNPKDFQMPTESLGGGVLGSHAYILANTGLNTDQNPDGGVRSHRRWSENILKDFFCRDLPVLNEMDVLSAVDRNSSVPFQKNPVCLKCHYTTDNLSAGLRNIVPSNSGYQSGSVNYARILVRIDTDVQSKTPFTRPNSDDSYPYSAPFGQLNYRNINDQFVFFDFANLDELGKHIANSKDFHYCVAKRYIKYFTGYNFQVTAKKEDSPQAVEFLKIADHLHEHRDPRLAIKEILLSSLFTESHDE